MTDRVRWLLAWLALAPSAAISAGKLVDSDPWWQIRTGQLIWDTGRLPAADPFSWTVPGRPWVLNSWGYDVLLAGAHHLGGMAGAALLGAVFAWLALGAMLLLARAWAAPPAAVVVVLVAGTVLFIPWFSSRPHLVDYAAVPLLILLVGLVLNRARSALAGLVGVVALQVVWVNLHAAATLGVLIVAILCAADAVTAGRRSPAWWRYAGLAAASVVGAVVNPYGLDVFTQASRVRDASATIKEWAPMTLSNWQDVAMLVVAAAAVAVAIVRRWWGPALIVIALAVAGATMVRFLPITGAVALPLVASAAGLPAVAAVLERRRRWLIAVVSVAVAAMLAPAGAALAQPGRSAYGTELTAALPSGCKLFNSYVLGGMVILARPDVPVSLDSRSDLYGAALITELSSLSVDDIVARGVTCVLVRSTDSRVAGLRTDPRWRLAVEDKAAVVFLRASPRL
ncbi:hypothetical protein GCM10009682_04160 [Luedemannella flava]|uniref:Glycosyltransferase RgtA/B/C/D-like domain-containing protein n=1 Tax=Luedemannella flava TaxID=349316 RepID=A0ABP4XN15_9ACTN